MFRRDIGFRVGIMFLSLEALVVEACPFRRVGNTGIHWQLLGYGRFRNAGSAPIQIGVSTAPWLKNSNIYS